MLGLGNSLITGGVSAEWTPADLPDLLHWYKYDTDVSTYTQTETTSNVLVTQWSDQKGSNHLVDSSTPSDAGGGAGSTYNISTPQIAADGKAVEFNNTLDVLLYTSALALTTFSYYVRISWVGTTFGDTVTETAAGDFLSVHTSTQARLKAGTRHDFNFDSVTLAGDGTKYNIGWERETTNDQLYVFLDNVAAVVDGSPGDGTESTQLDLTQIGQPAVQAVYYEIIICDDALSTANRAYLQTYLSTI